MKASKANEPESKQIETSQAIANHVGSIVQRKMVVGSAGDKYEQEADRMADQVMRMPDHSSIQRKCTQCEEDDRIQMKPQNSEITPFVQRQSVEEEEEEMIQAKADGTPTITPSFQSQLKTTKGGGSSLPPDTNRFMSNAFAADFSRVRVHSDSNAAQMSQSIQAKAFTSGNDIYFNHGQYSPGSSDGKKLLAHELTHTIQQSEKIRPSIQRQPNAAPPQPIWEQHLGEMLGCSIGTGSNRHLRTTTQTGQQIANPWQRCTGLLESISQSLTLHGTYSEAQLRYVIDHAYTSPAQYDFINANKVMGIIALYNAGGDLAAATNLMSTGTVDDLTPLTNRRQVGEDHWGQSVAFAYVFRALRNYANTFRARNTVDTIGTRPFDQQAGQANAPINYEQILSGYLDELLRLIPMLNLSQADKNRYFASLLIFLRRSMVTGTWSATNGMQNVVAITNAQVVTKYQNLVALITSQMTNRQNMNIITDSRAAYNLPNPVPAVNNSQFTINGNNVTVNIDAIPQAERNSVRFGVLRSIQTVFSGGGIQYRNAYWPVTLPVRIGGNIENIRYELVFDNNSNIRVERLGLASTRTVPPTFATLSVADKKAALIRDFGLSGIDNRGPIPATAIVPAQAAANWSGSDLDLIKTTFDRLPQSGRDALNGVALVRGHIGPSGPTLYGYAHTGNDPTYDNPHSPVHNPPHIHYYDAAFTRNDFSSVGQPHGSGPISEWTITHEVGHMVMNLPVRQANTAISAAGNIPGIAGISGSNAAHVAAWNAWIPLSSSVANDVGSYNAGITGNNQMTAAQLDALEVQIQANQVLRDNARSHADFPPYRLTAATTRDTAADNLFTASRQLRNATQHNDTFIFFANLFNFHQFTNYAATGSVNEWFAESYALYIADPNRLNEMNRNMFLWFEAGMPFDRSWRPAGWAVAAGP